MAATLYNIFNYEAKFKLINVKKCEKVLKSNG